MTSESYPRHGSDGTSALARSSQAVRITTNALRAETHRVRMRMARRTRRKDHPTPRRWWGRLLIRLGLVAAFIIIVPVVVSWCSGMAQGGARAALDRFDRYTSENPTDSPTRQRFRARLRELVERSYDG